MLRHFLPRVLGDCSSCIALKRVSAYYHTAVRSEYAQESVTSQMHRDDRRSLTADAAALPRAACMQTLSLLATGQASNAYIRYLSLLVCMTQV